MARTFGAIYLRIWRDQDWRTLGHTEQYLYMSLVCQPKLNRAGLLEYSPRRWADANATLSIHDVEVAVKNLEQRHYVVVDESTNELLVRTYVRNDEAWKQPKVMASVVSAANEIESPKLRYALLLELDRIPVDELSDSPGPNNGPSIRSKIEKCITQLRAVLGGDGPYDPGRAEAPGGTPTEGYRSATDTPGVPDAKGTRTHADTRAVAPSQRPAPTPAPEPEPEPRYASGTLFDPPAAEAGPADADKPRGNPETDARNKLAVDLTRQWWEGCSKKPTGKFVGRQQIVYGLLEAEHDPDDIAEALRRCGYSMTRASAEMHLKRIDEERERSASNVVPFVRPGQHQAFRDDPNRDYSLAGYLAERNGA